ncbi:DUF4870 domain-containing protein [Dermacoccus abyssi]|uniref:DUF4870 domain-containing protein n=1 Tax=Dermacoccus abyssi TaxID=322596 RepID=UPI002AD58A14|nr:DUF4870 domain-containing protein [Dermacoccus abyssi]
MSQQPYPTPDPQWSHNGDAYPNGRPTEAGVTPRQLSSDETGAAVVAHLSALVAAVVSAGSLSLVGPLIVWFIYKYKSPAVREAAAGAFNFNLSWWLLYWVGWLFAITFIGIVVAIPLWFVITVVALWCHIRGALNASSGRPYRYPFQLRVLS